ncbi:methyltransferase [Brasilonema sp. UFV-L1]|uniref:methyltransferase n=1 Tax=Brasilonema sp. UFV-L1 TaxID=2234130 RepID=UPI00145C55A6|nr:methyltransferase [Brasilonema sp. UFV-L1]NMG09781.1 hypothetical protein [Brasilonema sp. UFV-L1]
MHDKDIVFPANQWRFDERVADAFDEMLQRSIPDYSNMRALVSAIALKFLSKGGVLIDIGASKGEAVAPLVKLPECSFHLIDNSPSMLAALTERFADYKNVTVHDLDLRSQFLDVKASVVLSVLTLQFVPVEHRMKLLQRIYNSLHRNGAFVLVEKVIGATATVDDLITNIYYELKAENGYSDYEIQRKRLSLEGVLVPWTASANEQALKNAGFHQVECIWRWSNFAGWLAIK